MRIGFLFNHYASHQVPHAAPFAFELSRIRRDIEVVFACSTIEEMAMAEAIGALYPGHSTTFHRLELGPALRRADKLLSSWTLFRKRAVLKRNLSFFRTLDALVTPERHALKLRTDYGLAGLRIIHTRHGAGDREGSFDARCKDVDFSLLPGRKYVDGLQERGFLGPHAVVGCPKFEVVQKLNPKPKRLFDDDKPTVVYAPHFDQRLSSWQKMAKDVLDAFSKLPGYNLIVAPHVVLFTRRLRHGARMPAGFEDRPDILIDTGSRRSTDMTYMRAADIYLGDVSSQVYEFLVEPRPCIFLNAHGVDWRGDPHYRHFALGDVVDDVARGLQPALERAFSSHAQTYRARQEEAIAYTFHIDPDSTAAERGAEALSDFMDELVENEIGKGRVDKNRLTEGRMPAAPRDLELTS